MPDEQLSSGIFRYALGIEYRGTFYCGWQRQEQRPGALSGETVRPTSVQNNRSGQSKSVQGEIETALAAVANEVVSTVCAGRTDRGVHGREQVLHFATRARRPLKAWILGVNTHLPEDISVLWARQVPEDFHARFSATARTYRYVINNCAERPALSRELMTWIYEPLDAASMHRAAQFLLGENDFSSFRGAACQSKTPFRYLESIRVQREGEWVVVEVKANAFLHHMVRNIVGVLLEVGRGRRAESWVREVLESRDRCAAAATAPTNGLYLLRVDYPARFGLPQRRGPGTGVPF